MAYHYRIDPTLPIVLVHYTDTLKQPELCDSVRAVFEDAGFRPGYDVIWDASEVRQLVLMPGDLDQLVALKDAFRADDSGRDVLVAVREIDYVVARLYKRMARSSNQRVIICKSLPDALARLGLEDLPDAFR